MSASKKSKAHSPQFMSVKMHCIVCAHSWTATLGYGTLPNYVRCPDCAERDKKADQP